MSEPAGVAYVRVVADQGVDRGGDVIGGRRIPLQRDTDAESFDLLGQCGLAGRRVRRRDERHAVCKGGDDGAVPSVGDRDGCVRRDVGV